MNILNLPEITSSLSSRFSNTRHVFLAVIHQIAQGTVDQTALAAIEALISSDMLQDWYVHQAANAINALDSEMSQIKALDELALLLSRKRKQEFSEGYWISENSAECLINLLPFCDTVRCTYRATLHVALLLSLAGKAVLFRVATHSDIDLEAIAIARVLSSHWRLKEFAIESPEEGLSKEMDGERCVAEISLPSLSEKRPVDHINPKTTGVYLDLRSAKSVSLDAIALSEVLAGSNGRFPIFSVVLVSEGLLSRAVGPEAFLRRALFERISHRQIKAQLTVIGVPGNPYPGWSPIRRGLIIVDRRSEASSIRMLDLGYLAASNEDKLASWPASEKWKRAIEEACIAGLDEIKRNNNSLSVARYCSRSNSGSLSKLLTISHRRVPLETLVEFDRTPPFFDRHKDDPGDEREKAFEISPDDIAEDGVIQNVKRQIVLDAKEFIVAKQVKLNSRDILIFLKGQVGKVAIVPPRASLLENGDVWIAGSSAIILRPKQPFLISQEALFFYLSSQEIQAHLRGLAVGSVQSVISIEALRKLEVPLPDPSSETMAISAFEEIVLLQSEVEKLTQQIMNVKLQTWPNYLFKDL